MLILLAATTILVILVTYLILIKTYKSILKDKKILVIGGTSGLGREFAKQLYLQGNTVTITSRDIKAARQTASQIEDMGIKRSKIQCLEMDILDEKLPVQTEYDYIFCVPGFSISKYFKDQDISDFRAQMDLNYLATVNSLYKFKNQNKIPFIYIVISSTAALFYFPGYSSYSPTKSALLVFAKSVYPELHKEGIDLRVYLCPAMQTRGLDEENKLKPEFTKEIEFSNTIMSPEGAARYYLANIHKRRIIAVDWFTYFVMIKENCEDLVDYLFFPVAVVVVFISKMYVEYKFARIKNI